MDPGDKGTPRDKGGKADGCADEGGKAEGRSKKAGGPILCKFVDSSGTDITKQVKMNIVKSDT